MRKNAFSIDGRLLSIGNKIVVETPPIIYGVVWDGTSTTSLTRTDAAAGFPAPSPAVSNGSGSSPFDNIYPWSGMVRVTDDIAGELVAIPKFYYKWTKRGLQLSLQISPQKLSGFYTSPAHADRGDGCGERDIVYIGRYYCGTDYKSINEHTKLGSDCSIMRSGIHSLGDKYWQSDYAMRLTVQMLYLVEFASWDSQAQIGHGVSTYEYSPCVGLTDVMTYHTGTIASARDGHGATQYRNIENLWGSAYEWMDGCYYDGSNLRVVMNPNNYDTADGGTIIGSPMSGWIVAMNVAEANGVQWIFPSESNTANLGCIPDRQTYGTAAGNLVCGGYGSDAQNGLFCSYVYTSTNTSSRLQKLP